MAPGNLQTTKPSQPIGLAYIAGALRRAGHDVAVLDAIAEAPTTFTHSITAKAGTLMAIGLTHEDILARLRRDAEVIGIACMFSTDWPALRGLIHKIRARMPRAVIVCGGEHFTALAEHSMREAPIDYVVLGEGEEIVTRLLDEVVRPDFDPRQIEGICWRNEGGVAVSNTRASRSTDVDGIAWPAWDLFDMDAYNDAKLVGGLPIGRTMPILATRGCPYQCTYCASPQAWTTRWYARTPSKVVDEIESYVTRYRATNFPFQDLTMITKKRWIVEFCEELIARKLEITWQLPTGTRCDVVDDEVARLLYRSGCRWLSYAPESGSERTRKLIKKQMKTSDLMRALEVTAANGLHMSIFLVIGFPHDTAEDLRETVRLARRAALRGVEDVALQFFFPIPGTELFGKLETAGRLTADDDTLTRPAFGHSKGLSDERNYCDALTAAQLTRWKYWIIANFYLTSWLSHPARLLRIVTNTLRGRQTSVMEKFLAYQLARLTRRRRRAQGAA